MTLVGTAQLRIHPDTRGFGPALKQGILGPIKGIALAAGAVIGAAALGGLVKGSIDEARDAAKQTRITNQLIKQTEGVANVTGKGIDNLASKLSNYAAVDDDTIKQSSNLLLTFKSIRNEAGKGNAVFDRSAKAALDLSEQFGGLEGSTIQVAKAIEDPIKGLTALGKAGVTFTKQEKEKIKTLVESGHKLEAQKVILSAIEGQVGGVAGAAADPVKRLGVVFGNLKEFLGGLFLPILERVGTFLGDKLPGWIDTAKAAVGAFVNTFKTGFTEDEGTPIEKLALVFRGLWETLTTQIIPAVIATGAWINENLIPPLKSLGEGILAGLGTAFRSIADTIKDNKQGLSDLARVIKEGLVVAFHVLGPILKVMAIVFGTIVVVAIKILITQLATLGRIFDIIGAAAGATGRFFQRLFGDIKDAFSKIYGFLGGVGAKIKGIAKGMWDGITNAFKTAINFIIKGWNKLEFKIPGFDPPGPGKFGGFTLGVPNIPTLHSGGTVPGIPGHDVLINAEAGEHVFSRKDTARIGNTYQLTVQPISINLDEAEIQRLFANMELISGRR